jgi:hypothetical protein
MIGHVGLVPTNPQMMRLLTVMSIRSTPWLASQADRGAGDRAAEPFASSRGCRSSQDRSVSATPTALTQSTQDSSWCISFRNAREVRFVENSWEAVVNPRVVVQVADMAVSQQPTILSIVDGSGSVHRDTVASSALLGSVSGQRNSFGVRIGDWCGGSGRRNEGNFHLYVWEQKARGNSVRHCLQTTT